MVVARYMNLVDVRDEFVTTMTIRTICFMSTVSFLTLCLGKAELTKSVNVLRSIMCSVLPISVFDFVLSFFLVTSSVIHFFAFISSLALPPMRGLIELENLYENRSSHPPK